MQTGGWTILPCPALRARVRARARGLATGALLLVAAITAAAQTAATPALKVCLLSGSDEPAYHTDESLGSLARWLGQQPGFTCELVRWAPGHQAFENPQAIAQADALVIFVRRMPADAATLAAVRDVFARGAGVVGLRTASHAWETWPGFDREVLGAEYGRHGGAATQLAFPEPWHPILAGAAGFTTNADIYKYKLVRKAPDLDVLIEGTAGDAHYPVAWTTHYGRSRLFYLGLGADAEFAKPQFRQMIANALQWTSHREVPAARIRLERTLLPNARPSAMAIGFTDGVNCCYDPVRGGLSYAWEGGFIDLESVRPGMGKAIKPAKLLGPLRYEESGDAPLRHGDPTHVPKIAFKGYRLLRDAIELTYELDGVRVQELVAPRPDGRGIVRTFHPDPAAGGGAWWYLPGATKGGELRAPGGRPDAGGYRFEGESGGFTLEIVFGESKS